jgi:hypothetical protein
VTLRGLAAALVLACAWLAPLTASASASPFESVRAQARNAALYRLIDNAAFAEAEREAAAAEEAAPTAQLRAEAAFLRATALLRLGDPFAAEMVARRAGGA